MKRSKMLRDLHRKLKQWENCKIRMKETRELLQFIEERMQPPIKQIEADNKMIFFINAWDEEDESIS